MTLEQVTELFPEREFTVFWVDRGVHGRPAFMWAASWDFAGCEADRTQFTGQTPDEAVTAMARHELEQRRLGVVKHEATLQRARANLADMETKLAGCDL